MFTKLFNWFVAIFFIFTSLSYAQNNSWSIALKSSYFGDQARNLHQITAIDNPISMGIQLQFFPRADLALQYSVENMSGKTQEPNGNELNVQSSLALVAYPMEFRRFRPYFVQGVLWGRQNNNGEAVSRGSLYFEFGLGTEFALSGNLFSSLSTKMYTNGWNYHGWSTSLSFGYRL